MANLFELSTAQREILELIEKGELSPDDAKDTLEGNEGMLKDKLTDYCHVFQNMSQSLNTINCEIDRLEKLKKQKENEIKNLKNWMLVGLDNAEIKSIDLGLFKISTRAGSKSVRVIDMDKIPDMYVNIKSSFSADKTAIKKALDAKVKVPGVEIVTGERSLSIK